jgi:hypothetical protein
MLVTAELCGFFYFQNVTALVSAALGASVMGQLALMAVGTLRRAGGGEKVMGAAAGAAALGVASFWIRHGSSFAFCRTAGG